MGNSNVTKIKSCNWSQKKAVTCTPNLFEYSFSYGCYYYYHYLTILFCFTTLLQLFYSSFSWISLALPVAVCNLQPLFKRFCGPGKLRSYKPVLYVKTGKLKNGKLKNALFQLLYLNLITV